MNVRDQRAGESRSVRRAADASRRRAAWAMMAFGMVASACGGQSLASQEVPADRAADASDQVQIEIGDAEQTEAPAPIATTDPPAGDAPTDEPADDDEGGAAPAAPRYTVVAQATADAITARTEPSADAAPIAELNNPTASGAPLVFQAVHGGASSAEWIEVLLPVQPNGTTGWIPRDSVGLSDNPYRVEISRDDYSLRVFHLNELWVETPIAVGNGDTPTPVGDFYLLELLQPADPTGPYGPYAFGLSGFSEVLTSFGGADEAIIGLHGTNDPSSLGTDVSHGCIRLDNDIMEQFAEVLPLGTPVSIT